MKNEDFLKLICLSILSSLFLFQTNLGYSQECCSDNLITDPSFEEAFTADENFPDSALSPAANANTTNSSEWDWSDGSNQNGLIFVDDATRASDGDQFIYLKTYPTPSADNHCAGNQVNEVNDTDFNCSPDEFANGFRYAISFDWAAFNEDVPAGGATAGVTAPRFEHDFPAFTELYDANGVNVSVDGPTGTLTGYTQAVDWANVATSWQRAYGVTPALSAGNNTTLWVSHADDGTAGMLADNVLFTLLSFTEIGMINIDCGDADNEISFDLNPNANQGGTPGIMYDVTVPAGFTVSPAQGTYGQTTNFRLIPNSGDFASGTPATVDITVTDEVNTMCTVTSPLANPFPCDDCPQTENCINQYGEFTITKRRP